MSVEESSVRGLIVVSRNAPAGDFGRGYTHHTRSFRRPALCSGSVFCGAAIRHALASAGVDKLTLPLQPRKALGVPGRSYDVAEPL